MQNAFTKWTWVKAQVPLRVQGATITYYYFFKRYYVGTYTKK